MSGQVWERFTADRDITDSLKIEASSVSPEFNHTVQGLIPGMIKGVVDDYYPYIPTATLERLKTLPDRFVVTDEDTYSELQDCWSGTKIKSGGTFKFHGNLIFIKDPKSCEDFWDTITAEAQLLWVNRYKTEKEAKKTVGLMSFCYLLLHEVVHSFHPTSGQISLGFIEYGCCYYTEEVAKKNGLVSFSLPDDWRAEIYRSFLKTQGELPHDVFFGTEQDPTKIHDLNQAFIDHCDRAVEVLEELCSPIP